MSHYEDNYCMWSGCLGTSAHKEMFCEEHSKHFKPGSQFEDKSPHSFHKTFTVVDNYVWRDNEPGLIVKTGSRKLFMFYTELLETKYQVAQSFQRFVPISTGKTHDKS